MMKPLYIAAFLVAVTLTYGLYSMKYEVQRLESKLLTLHSQLTSEREATQVLRAEWSYLNRPERLEKLTLRHLDLTPVSVHRMAAVTRLPFRENSAQSELHKVTPAPNRTSSPNGTSLPNGTSPQSASETSWRLPQTTKKVR